MSRPRPRAYVLLLRATRWRMAIRGALLVVGVLAVLSAGAFITARHVVYGQLQQRLEEAAHHVEPAKEGESAASAVPGYVVVGEGPDNIIPWVLPNGAPKTTHLMFVPSARYGTLAVLPRAGHRHSAVAIPVEDDIDALRTFVHVLIGLTVAAGVVALPAGYLLAGQALRPLDEAVRARNEFVALASHRLRTPLSIIRTSSELARSGQGLGPPEALDIALQQTAHLEQLAERLSTLTRAELAPGPATAACDLRAVAERLGAALAPQAQASGVHLAVQAPRPVMVAAAETDITDLLTSVTENALRFAKPDGHVTIRVDVAGRFGLLEVEDDGPGIDPRDLPHVTRPFFQGRRVRGGSGLGLAIADAITERLGGRLELTATPGAGTRARMLLPLSTGRRRPPTPDAVP